MKYRQFFKILLWSEQLLYCHFFHRHKKYINFFVNQFIIKDCSLKKIENSETIAKSYYKANKEKLKKKDCASITEIFLKIMLTLKTN